MKKMIFWALVLVGVMIMQGASNVFPNFSLFNSFSEEKKVSSVSTNKNNSFGAILPEEAKTQLGS